MRFISIDKFIDFVRENKIPNQYYRSRFHRDFIKSLSLGDYSKWESYLQDKKIEWKKRNKEKQREYNYRYYHKDEYTRQKRLQASAIWYEKNKEKVYAGLRRRYWEKKFKKRRGNMRIINVLNKENFIVIKQGYDEIIIEKSNVELINDLIRQLEEVKKEQK